MTYAETAQLYVEAGWGVPFPLPAGRKHPPPDGTTGQHGVDLGMPNPYGAGAMEDSNYGLRMPVGVMGLDVDVYGDKHGDVVLAELEARLGPLPAGPWSSSRAWPSGIRFYRLPVGHEATRLRGAIPGGIEIIQRHHRYAVVWPSVVEGREYVWHWLPGGPQMIYENVPVPKIQQLPELPAAWLAWLAEGASAETGPGAGSAEVAELEAVLFSRSGLCPAAAGLLADADARMAETGEGGRHDAMGSLAFRAAHTAAEGHLSWGAMAEQLGALWEQYVGDPARGSEFARLMRTALGKVQGGTAAVSSSDPCSVFMGLEPQDWRPGDTYNQNVEITIRDGQMSSESAFEHPGDETAQALAEASPSTIQVAGVQVFDPMNAYDDRAMGLAVLAHVGAGVRYLTDSGGWLHRGPEAWTVRTGSLSDGARSCVAVAVRSMPRGRRDADEGSDEKTRAERYKTFTSSAGLGRVSQWVAAEVSAPGSPLGLRLADLDAEPELLWAGGRAWDLRASAERPVPADLDPGTPHARTAGATPAPGSTPLWDAFCAAVWPDPEQRAWALRVLGIAVTGYADRAMPIFWGDRGRGKTQVLALVSDVLGNYAVAADPRLLGSGEHHGSVLLALAGARLAWIDEGPRSGHWATERLKALTGGGEMTGNPMRGNPVTFRPSHTLCLTSNDEPQVSDEALRSRVRSIECAGSPEAVREARLAIGNLRGAGWAAERPGVLAALMGQAAAWLDDPRSSDNPLAVEAVLERLAREQDPVLAWMDDRTVPDRWSPAGVLYEDFRVWCQRSGIDQRKVPNLAWWGRSLTRAGVPSKRTAAGMLRGLGLHTGGSGASTLVPTGGLEAMGFGANNAEGTIPPSGSAPTGAQSVATSDGRNAPTKPDLTRESATSEGTSLFYDSEVSNKDTVLKSSSNEGFSQITGTCAVTALQAPEPTERKTHDAGQDERRAAVAPAGDAEGLVGHEDPEQGGQHGAGELVDPSGAGVAGVRGLLREPEVRPVLGAEVAQGAGGAGRAPEPGPDDALPAAPARGVTEGLPAVVVRTGGTGLDQAPVLVHRADLATVSGLLGTLAGQSVTLDVEHSGYPIGHPDFVLRTIQLGTPAFSVVLDAADPEQVSLAGLTLDRASEIVAHAAQADIVPVALAQAWAAEAMGSGGPENNWAQLSADAWWPKVTDTAVVAALVDPHLTGADRGHALDLKGLSGRLLPDAVSPQGDKDRAAYFRKHKWLTNTEPTTPVERSGWAQADYSEPVMAAYAAGDVLDTATLRETLPDIARTAPDLMARERRVLGTVARISLEGMRLDRDWTLAKHAEATQAKAGLVETLAGMGAPDPASTAKLSARFAELGADLPRTKTGQLSTDKDALATVIHQEGPVGDLARVVTDWRAKDTVLKLLLTPYRELVLRGDSRVRPTIQTLGALATGRMSTVRPNLQQVSKVGGIRGCIVADPGHLLISADFASVEVRVAAALSGDEGLATMIREGLDMHGRIAGLVFGPGYAKAQRYAIKAVVFGKMYGAGKTALARQLGPDGHRVDDVIDAMEQIMPGFVQWADRLQHDVRRGLRPVWRHPSGRLTYLTQDTPHKAPNYAIQSTSRELLVDALERWEQVRPGHVLLPIHDEILVQVPEDQAEQATLDLVQCMTTEVAGVPILAEASPPTDRWRDAS